MKINLNGKWLARNTKKQSFFNADVPGDIFLASLTTRQIKDPFWGTNEKKAYELAENDFEYQRKFWLNEDIFDSDEILLCLDQIDTIADVFINDYLVCKLSNAHISYKIDIKSSIKKGENSIKILIYSPLKYVREKNEEYKMPSNMFMGINGIQHIRKPQCHFGWDWGLKLPLMGITRDIYLESKECAKIIGTNIEQVHKHDNVKLLIDVDVVRLKANVDCNVEVIITKPDGKIIKEKSKDTHFVIEIKDPELWWTKDLSEKEEQPLYIVDIKLYDNEKLLDTESKKIGLRTITLDKSEDSFGRNFRFLLNGVPIFAKGANLIPTDAMITRSQNQKFDYLVDCALKANMNMLRVWGGGYYESDYLYDLCDKYGLLVWQDFCFACLPFPFDDKEFLINVLQEVKSNVNRLKHRASLALWCGNNEIETLSSAWFNRINLKKWTEKFFYDILPKELEKYDKITPYIPGSPTSYEFLKDVNGENHGDTHMWDVWHGLKPLTFYRKKHTRFCSEFGLQSLPSMDTIKSFAEETDFNLKSEVMQSHQKCIGGNGLMLYYLASRFNIPKSFDDLVYFTSLIQAECVVDATEHFRRNKGRCNGALYWQLNDCWGVSSWASIDYMGKCKALQYKIKDANSTLSISIEDTKERIKVFLINDYTNNQNVRLDYKIIDFKGNIIDKGSSQDYNIDALTIKEIYNVSIENLDDNQRKNSVFVADLYKDDKRILQKTICFMPEKSLNLFPEKISYQLRQDNENLYIDIKASNYIRNVAVDIEGVYKPFTDNYFDILPKDVRTISIPLKDAGDLSNINSRLKIKCTNNIVCNKSKLSNLLVRAKIRLKPVNILKTIFYLFN